MRRMLLVSVTRWCVALYAVVAGLGWTAVAAGATSWTGLGDNTTWSQLSNWSNGVPTSLVDADIPVGAGPTIVVSSAAAVRTLTAGRPIRVSGSNALTITGGLVLQDGMVVTLGDATGYGLLTFSGGTQSISLAGGATSAEIITGATGTTGAGYLDAVSGCALTIGAGVTYRNNGGDANLRPNGGCSVTNLGVIRASGTGRTLASNTAGTLTNSATGQLQSQSGALLNLTTMSGNVGSLSISGTSSRVTLGGTYTLNQAVTVPATCTLTLNGSWTNSSTITINGGTVNYGGTFSSLGGLSRSGGTVNFTGTFNNAGTFTVGNATGPINFETGTVINGGTLLVTDGQALTVTGSTALSGVTVGGPLRVSGNNAVTITGGLVLQDGTVVTLGDSTGYGVLGFSGGTQAISLAGGAGSAEIITGATGTTGAGYLDAVSGCALTIGAGVTYRNNGGDANLRPSGGCSVTNLGVIRASGTGRSLFSNSAGTLINSATGQLQSQSGAVLNLTTMSGNVGSLSISGTSSRVTLSGTYAINQPVTVPATCTLTLNGSWTNSSTITINGGTVNYGGTFATLGGLSRSGGTVNFTGTFNNGGTFTVSNATGPINFETGTVINGGTLLATDGQALTVTGSTAFSGVTVGGPLRVSGSNAVTITGGLVLQDGTVVTLGDATGYGVLGFSGGTQSISLAGGAGSAEIITGATGTIGAGYIDAVSGCALTIGSGVTYRTNGGDANLRPNSGCSVTNQGVIRAGGTGRSLFSNSAGTLINSATGQLQSQSGALLNLTTISGNVGALSISGTSSRVTLSGTYTLNQPVTVPATCTLTLNGSWTNSSTITISGGTVNYGGTFSTLGGLSRSGGTVNFTGTFNNAGTFTVNNATGPINFDTSTVINGGTLLVTDGQSITVTGSTAFNGGVKVGGSLRVSGSNAVTITGGLVLQDGTVVTLGDATGYGVLGFSGGTQSISLAAGGTAAEIVAGAAAGAGPGYIDVLNNGALTLGAGITFRASGGNGNIRPAAGSSFTNAGTVRAEANRLMIFSQSGSITNYNPATNTLTGGRWEAYGANAVIDFADTVSIRTIGAGTDVTIVGPGANMPELAALTTIAGSFTLAGRNFPVVPVGGVLTNTGVLTIGPAGVLAITGDYVQTAAGVYNSQIDGPDLAHVGQISATGTATLAGTVNVAYIGGYQQVGCSGSYRFLFAGGGVAGHLTSGQLPVKTDPYVAGIGYYSNAVTFVSAPHGDIVSIGGFPPGDGLLTGDDFVAFVNAFAAGDLLADVTGIGGPPSEPDGLVTGDDFIAFVNSFAAGC